MLLLAGAGAAALAQPACAAPGAHLITVTNDPTGADYGPQFSPDSTRLIFERTPLGGRGPSQTYWVPLQGGVPQPFLQEKSPVGQTRLRWSAATNRIAFTGISQRGFTVLAAGETTSTWLMDPDGTHLRQVSPPGGPNVFYPTWYPDGAHLLEMDGDHLVPLILDVNTGATVPVKTTPALLTGMASVSPDGKWIAAAGQKDVGQRYDQTVNQIWLISQDGEAHPLEPGNMEGRAPTWSPDGSQIVFESNRGGEIYYAIFAADRDGTNVRQLTPYGANAQHPVWSPDGKWLAFSVRESKASGFGPGIAIIAAPALTP